jgi:CRISPR-associated endonuclease/helicase Cas3
MLDVAAVAEAIVQRESSRTQRWAAEAFGVSESTLPRWLAVFCGLHDFGKAIPGFQMKWPEGQAADVMAGLCFTPACSLMSTRHDLASTALLQRALSLHYPNSSWIQAIVQALGAHHGYFPRPQEMREGKPLQEDSEWGKAREQLLAAYLQALQPGETPSQTEIELPAAAWLAGLTSVADWIGSNQEWFPPGERADSLTGHHAKAQALAEKALDEIGWTGFQPLLKESAGTDSLIRRILGSSDTAITARPLQHAADRLLSNPNGPCLMLVEAPMGEGKTELAFLAHLRLQAANGHRGLYVALPTQATGNAMFDRALTFLNSIAPGVRLDIQLAHGGAMLDERIHQLRGVNASKSESISSSAWFSQRKRPLLSPYGVGTIDQALFATLHVKHHFVRLWGLANRVVVLDEVHAYDTYTSGLIEALLRWLKAMNCSVVLMSATLPTKRRDAFLNAWGTGSAPEIDYPRVLVANDENVQGEHIPCRPLAPIAVTGISEALDVLATSALESLGHGGCGAVIVNTVQRAQDLYSQLKPRLAETYGDEIELLLFHARYPADERSEREKQVLNKFGRGDNVTRPVRALLIATQVVEQSLDIDFDFMISDLAPVDLLLQRAGRLHRHERQRPAAHAVPQLTVAGFQRENMPELKETAWGFVYDPYILYRTWAIAGAEHVWQLPEDIDRLVQAVYGTTDLLELTDHLDEKMIKTIDMAYGESRADIQQQERQAINVTIDCDAEVQNAYNNKPRGNEEGEGFDKGLKAVTRLGDEGISIVPVLESDEGWRLFPEDVPFDRDSEPSHALAHRIYRRQLRLSRNELVNALLAKTQTQTQSKAFELHPLLRNLRPLVLTDGIAVFERLRVRLDPELGITYESTKPTTTKEDA